MFDPGNRKVYLENLQPPDGYRLECALATTFSLDLMSLLMAPLSMIMSEAQDKDEALKDPIALVEALQRSADRLAIFCHQGRISIPRTETRLYRYLEQTVVEVRSPNKNGVFHPKLWILKFIADDEYPVYRLICLSRNLTFDRSWDIILSMDGYIEDQRHVYRENKPLQDFVNSLSGLSVHPVLKKTQNIVDKIVRDIPSIIFEKPEGFQNAHEFIPLGIPGYDRKFTLGRAERSLILSPFLSGRIISTLEKHGKNNILISRLEELDKIDAEVLEKLRRNTKVYVFSDEADLPEEQQNGSTAVETDDSNSIPDETELSGLHAKLYITESDENTHLYFGSANATDAGLHGKNTEFLIGLTADRESVSINTLFSFDDKDGITSMINEYHRERPDVQLDDAALKLEKLLHDTRELIIRTNLRAVVSAADDKKGYDIALSGQSLPVENDALKNVRVYPVTLDKDYARPLEDIITSQTITFPSVSVVSITSFFAFEINAEYKDKKQRLNFVLNLPVEGIPEERDRAILQNIISDRGKFIRYIILLLSEETNPARMMNLMARYRYGLDDKTAAAARNIPLLEELVRAYSRSPEKLDRINEIVRDLTMQEDGNEILPEGFEEIWEVFRQVLSEERNK